MNTKRCKSCGTDKPAEEFYSHRRTPDGLQSRCKECHAAYYRLRSRRGAIVLPLGPDRQAALHLPPAMTAAEADTITRVVLALASHGPTTTEGE